MPHPDIQVDAHRELRLVAAAQGIPAADAALSSALILHRAGLSTFTLVDFLLARHFARKALYDAVAALEPLVAAEFRAAYQVDPFRVPVPHDDGGMRRVPVFLEADRELVERVFAAWAAGREGL